MNIQNFRNRPNTLVLQDTKNISIYLQGWTHQSWRNPANRIFPSMPCTLPLQEVWILELQWIPYIMGVRWFYKKLKVHLLLTQMPAFLGVFVERTTSYPASLHQSDFYANLKTANW